MPAEEKFGMPEVFINFKTQSGTAIHRSARGIVAMILKAETTDTTNRYVIKDVATIPEKLGAENVDLIKKCLLGTPFRILVFTLPNDTVQSAKVTQSTILNTMEYVKFNYICHPTGTSQEQEDLASWIKSMRINKRKTFKAVVYDVTADHEGVINLGSDDYKVIDREKTTKEKTVYKNYTGIQYTARMAGILAGLPLDRSATYYRLHEVESVKDVEDINDKIDKGKLMCVDEMDGEGVKLARASNSLTTFTTDKGEKFRYIKIIEAIDLIQDDIRDTFKKYYIGNYINDYNHKMLLISIINIYLKNLRGNVLDASKTAKNYVEIDFEAQKDFAVVDGADVEKMTDQEILEYNTGTKIFLVGRITPVNAMEDLTINFSM